MTPKYRAGPIPRRVASVAFTKTLHGDDNGDIERFRSEGGHEAENGILKSLDFDVKIESRGESLLDLACYCVWSRLNLDAARVLQFVPLAVTILQGKTAAN